jgi:hypothetical protein
MTRARWPAWGALALIAAVVAALAAGSLHGSARRHVAGRTRPGQSRTSAPARAGAALPAPARQAAAGTAGAPAPTPVSPALAAELEARGHELLEAGESAAAVPALQEALRATGMRLGECLEPVDETCLTYAYALYDLGRALSLDHQPAAAVVVLEQRLQIANQRGTVQAELGRARAQAGRPLLAGSGTG